MMSTGIHDPFTGATFAHTMHGAAALLLALTFSPPGLAQGPGASYPRKPVRLIVPFAPGGPVDIIARSLTPGMSQALGQQVVVDNRGGAGSVIGTELAAQSPPDGHTLLMVSGSYVMNPAMVKKLPYDSLEDFDPISLLAEVPSALVVHPVLPARSVKELIALARSHPGQLNYSSPGRGTLGHLAAELFSSMADVRMEHIAYKGAGPALVDLVAGHVQLLFAALPGVVQATRDGKVRMLAQTGRTRSDSMPDVPTVVEIGLQEFVVTSPFGLLAPAGTPRSAIDRVREASLSALEDAATRKRIASLGAEPVGSTPEELDRVRRAEMARWIDVTRRAGIEPR